MHECWQNFQEQMWTKKYLGFDFMTELGEHIDLENLVFLLLWFILFKEWKIERNWYYNFLKYLNRDI